MTLWNFTDDAALDDDSNRNLVVDPAAFMPGDNYLPGIDGGSVGIHDALSTSTVRPASPADLREPVDDAGGVVAPAVGGVSWECDNCDTRRLITGGPVTGSPSPVPGPAPLALIPGALFAGRLLLRRHVPRREAQRRPALEGQAASGSESAG